MDELAVQVFMGFTCLAVFAIIIALNQIEKRLKRLECKVND